ncbi:MAG: PIG-L family deacetylase, partial [Candidatus Omnitrophota bacterium]
MRILLPVMLLGLVLVSGCSHLPIQDSFTLEGVDELEPIRKNERVLIMAPHPDDEAIACAGIIQKAIAAGAEVKVVYLTNGDHNQVAFIVYEKRLTFRKGEFIHMGQVRHSEAVKAMKLFGLDESRLVFLGYPDFGTFVIFRDFWNSKNPYKSMLTRISHVPYRSNLSYNAPYTAESILNDIKDVLRSYRPDRIFVSHPSDTNPDHKAFYLFLQVALWDLEGQIPPPKVYPYLVHCPGWPLPRHYHPKLQLGPPRQYPVGGGIKWFRSDISQDEIENKHKAILCYRSQTQSSAFYLLAFARRNELFGNYPTVVLDLGKDVFPASREWVMPVLPFLRHTLEDSRGEN